MNQIALSIKAGVASTLAFFATISIVPSACAASADVPKATACAFPDYHQFDFWIGDWDAFDIGGPAAPSAHVRVDRILDGCVLLEQYEDNGGQKGRSFTIWDTSRKVWHQTWVTNHGQLLVIEGTGKAGAITLVGEDRTAEGKKRLVRGTWKPVPEGVRESAVRSVDGGKTWEPWFDILFKPHKE